ncbi:hypothetical protein [Vreelandella lionensis]|nr:hypothetical protein [Halomonas lionensis]
MAEVIFSPWYKHARTAQLTLYRHSIPTHLVGVTFPSVKRQIVAFDVETL